VNILYRILFYIKYLFISRSKFRIHSPFIYNYDTIVINGKRRFYAFDDIEYLRKKLSRNKGQIEQTAFGASGNKKGRQTKSIGKTVRRQSVTKEFGRLLFRTILYFKPKNILELGSGMGISTAYMAAANSKTRIISIEGSKDNANVAKLTMELLGYENVDIRKGQFMELLPKALDDLSTLDMVFIDGDHTEEATVKLFKQILPKLHNNSIVVFHDIHWSAEMTRAWEHIINMPEANVTIDLFFAGMVFLRREQAREHFYIWY